MQELKIQENSKVLILSPHPDDEIFCCSGILMQYPKQCDVILLTDGCLGNPEWTNKKTAIIRSKEFHAVMKKLDVHKYIELGIHDNTLKKNKKILKQLPYKEYDYIFLPNRYDSHSDHKCIYKTVSKICRWKKNIKIFEYELWGTLRRVTHYIDISDRISNKNDLIELYDSQKSHIDYKKRINALNYYRAISLQNVNYVECFYRQDYIRDCKKLILKLIRRIKKFEIAKI